MLLSNSASVDIQFLVVDAPFVIKVEVQVLVKVETGHCVTSL